MSKRCLIAATLCLCSLSSAHAGRFIATPFAETPPQGRYQLWHFSLLESRSTHNWRNLNRLDLALTDQIELGLFVINPRKAPTDTWVNIQFRLTNETESVPTLAVGVWDAARIQKPFGAQRRGGSLFFAAAKTVFSNKGKGIPRYIKVGLNAGTNRLNGLFGGTDIRFTERAGLMVEFVPKNLRLPNTEAVDVGIYHWLHKNLRIRVSWMGGNHMLDVVFQAQIGR